MKHLVLVGACYLDTILREAERSLEEDSKLRAGQIQQRRGGNCPNSLEVLAQLLEEHGRGRAGGPLDDADAADDDDDDDADDDDDDDDQTGGGHDAVQLQLHMVSVLPDRASPATERILGSFGRAGHRVSAAHCLFRSGHAEPSSSYVIRSGATGSRTVINHVGLAEMTLAEFDAIVDRFGADDDYWFHFEGRIPTTTLNCMQRVRRSLATAKISVEVEKPGRDGLEELAAEADVVFFSRAWAEKRGHSSGEGCLGHELSGRAWLGFCTWGADGATARTLPADRVYRYPAGEKFGHVQVVDSIGAGDTFVAGVLYGLTCHSDDWDTMQILGFATELGTLKVQREGFDDLGADAMRGWGMGGGGEGRG